VTLLHVACARDGVGLRQIKFLLAHGADVNMTCNYGKSPLIYALGSSREEKRKVRSQTPIAVKCTT
jgi:ankyrin repeat protein